MDESTNNLLNAQFTFLRECQFWPKAAIVQGHQLLQLSAEMDNLMTSDPENFFDNIPQIEERQFLIRLYDENFLIALNRTIFFLDRAANHFKGFKKIVDSIDQGIGEKHVQKVRGIRTHIDEYAKGKGDDRDNLFFTSPDNYYMADATSTIVIDGKYMLGGRIDVQLAIDLISKSKPEIDKLCTEHTKEVMAKLFPDSHLE